MTNLDKIEAILVAIQKTTREQETLELANEALAHLHNISLADLDAELAKFP